MLLQALCRQEQVLVEQKIRLIILKDQWNRTNQRCFGFLKKTSGKRSEFLSRRELALALCAWAKKFVFSFVSHELRRLLRPDLGVFRIPQIICWTNYLQCRTFSNISHLRKKVNKSGCIRTSIADWDGRGPIQDTCKDCYSRIVRKVPPHQTTESWPRRYHYRSVLAFEVFNFNSHISISPSLVVHLSGNRQCKVLLRGFSRAACEDSLSHVARFLLQEMVTTA